MPTPAPQRILEIQHKNPAPPTNTDWAKNRGLWPNHSDLGYEWVQVMAPPEEYDQFSLVGASGWVINPPAPGENPEDVFDSAADIPFDHPFQFDWEFQVALDDDQNDYASLLSPANGAKKEEGDINAAKDLGLTVPANGLLGVEWEKGLLPQSFRSQVKHGDRTAVFGRWILDEGHDVEGNYRTEIHPPLLLATASVQQSAQEPAFTRVLFMSRPYLVGQTFCVDPKNAYIDGTDDDGSFWDHLLKECIKVIGPPVLNIVGIGESLKVEAHPKIKSHPFLGAHLLHIIVRPPALSLGPRHGAILESVQGHHLAVSFHFTVRSGCAVQVTATGNDTVDIFISLNHAGYTPPALPSRKDRNYQRDELDQLSAGSGLKILELDALFTSLGALTGGAIDNVKVAAVLSTGIKTDEYDPLPEVDILSSADSVTNALADNIPAGKGVTVSDQQPYPIYGWLEAKWVKASAVIG